MRKGFIMRIAVAGRCNMRCCYCPAAMENYTFEPRAELTVSEMREIVTAAAHVGVRIVSLTGG